MIFDITPTSNLNPITSIVKNPLYVMTCYVSDKKPIYQPSTFNISILTNVLSSGGYLRFKSTLGEKSLWYYLPTEIGTIKKISFSSNHVAIISGDNRLWVAGRNDKGQLGLGTNKYHIDGFTRVVNIFCKDVSCGEEHTAVVDVNNRLMLSGSNRNGQLGMGRRAMVVKFTPHVMGGSIKKVVCGSVNTYYIDSSRKLWSAGANNLGQTGVDNKNTNIKVFTNIGKNMIEVQAGENHMVARNNNMYLFLAGSNQLGQLTINKWISDDVRHTRQIVNTHIRVNSIYAGAVMTAVRTDEGDTIAGIEIDPLHITNQVFKD